MRADRSASGSSELAVVLLILRLLRPMGWGVCSISCHFASRLRRVMYELVVLSRICSMGWMVRCELLWFGRLKWRPVGVGFLSFI